jgi:hypothetical protein
MTMLHISPYSIKDFTHNFESKMLVSDMSDLGRGAGKDPFVQLYDDACDIGIAVYNPRTGSTTHWYLVADVRNSEDELTHWILQPTNESCRRHPGVQCYTMHIFND